MFVLIESFLGNKLITGKKCPEKELRARMKKVIELIEKTEDFIPLFCRLFDFQEAPLSNDIHEDFVIDLDTHLVYAPKHGYSNR